MQVFISHSFENKPEFDNIADALTQAGVGFWNPAEVKPGNSLRDELRRAVEDCSVCIFVATHMALKSSWCGAELGAFWGAGKPIIVYVADSSLKDDELPPVVQGDVWERRLSLIARRAKELVAEAGATAGEARGARPAHVGSMTVEQLEKLIVGAVSLAAATGKTGGHPATPEEIGQAAKGAAGHVLEGIRTTERVVQGEGERWRKHILWVDDNPDNNAYERSAFESMGIEFTLALSTREALDILSRRRFGAIISDMGRREGPKEGYVLLDAVRGQDRETPFFIYAGSNSQEHQRETAARGAQGTTNIPHKLFDMVLRALPEVPVA